MIATCTPPPEGKCPVCNGMVVRETRTSARSIGTGDCMCTRFEAVAREIHAEHDTLPEPKGDEPWRRRNRHKYDFAR